MNRRELYKQIINLDLHKEVKRIYGVNYTNCRNVELEALIKKTLNEKAKKVKKSNSTSNLEYKFNMLVDILKSRHLLLQPDVDMIMNA